MENNIIENNMKAVKIKKPKKEKLVVKLSQENNNELSIKVIKGPIILVFSESV